MASSCNGNHPPLAACSSKNSHFFRAGFTVYRHLPRVRTGTRERCVQISTKSKKKARGRENQNRSCISWHEKWWRSEDLTQPDVFSPLFVTLHLLSLQVSFCWTFWIQYKETWELVFAPKCLLSAVVTIWRLQLNFLVSILWLRNIFRNMNTFMIFKEKDNR